MGTADPAGGILTIDLDAIAANYRFLREQLDHARCGAAVKCDAYGLGMGRVADRLSREGCEHFFVALADEAVSLRQTLSDSSPKIYVLNGLSDGAEEINDDPAIIPVLNTLAELERWKEIDRNESGTKPAVLNIDTGINRLGLDSVELAALIESPEILDGLDISFVMSHLACADIPDHPLNQAQLTKFSAALKALPERFPASLANSPGIFLGAEYHFDLARPGAALYGINPLSEHRKKLQQVANLQGKIIQLRFVDTNMTVGYGATHSVTRDSRIATVAMGYGDGIFRSLGNRGTVYLKGFAAPIIGRISMDLITIDVTDVPEQACRPGAYVEFIGEHQSVDDLAEAAGTIGYEILTALGGRYTRQYRES